MKRIILLIIIIFNILILTSCWGSRELNDIALVAGVAIDKSDTGYIVSLQIMVPKEIASKVTGETTTVTLYSEEGESIFQAIRKLTNTLPRKGYFPHLMAIIIDEKIASKYLLEVMDFFLRDPEIRPDVPIFVAKDTSAKNILKLHTHIENISASLIKKAGINLYTNYMGYQDVTLMDLINKIVSKGANPALIGISLKGEIKDGEKIDNTREIEPKSSIYLSQIAVFKKDKLIGWLSDEESMGYSYLSGKIKSSIITIPCAPNKTNSLEITSFKNKIDLQMVDNKPIINLTYKINSNIGQLGCPISLDNKEEIEKYKRLFAEKIINDSKNTLNVLQKNYKSDIIGFGEIIHRKNPKLWKKIKDDWDSHFENLTININADINISRPGGVKGNILKKILE